MLINLNYYIRLITILSFNLISAQVFDLNEIIPNTPQVSEINEVLSPSIDEFTGKVNVNIPIYTIEIADFKLPISLQYNSEGFKVGKESTWIGNSWSLIAGGVISRNQMGTPDDVGRDIHNRIQTSFYTDPFTGVLVATTCSVPVVSSGPRGWLYSINNTNGFQEAQSSYKCAENYYLGNNSDESCIVKTTINAENGFDLAPDIFSLSMVNLSGRFFFSDPDRVDFFKKENFKVVYEIENENFGISKFNIYDTKGNQYTFEEIEYQKYQRDYWNGGAFLGNLNISLFEPIQNVIGLIGSSSFWGAYASLVCQSDISDDVYEYMDRLWPNAWFLTKIITNTKKEILFEYDREQSYSLGVTHSEHNYLGSISNNINGWVFGVHHKNRLQEIESPRLKKIIWDLGEIDFIEGIKRQDKYININKGINHNSKELDKIIVKNYKNQIIKIVKFNHSYNLSEGYSESFPDYKKSVYKRLWLDSIGYFNRLGKKIDGYNFTYNNNLLPNKYSFEQDYWGYYNNNNANSLIPNLWFYPDENLDIVDKGNVSLFPRASYVGSERRLNDYITYPNFDVADRRPNDNFSTSGMLEKVDYFLGGSAEYIYEGNEFLYRDQSEKGPGVRIKRTILKESINDTKPILIDYNYDFDGKTTGKLSTLPIFTGQRHQASSFPYNSIDVDLNGSIGYTRVEKVYFNNSLGKEIFEFTFPVQVGNSFFSIPSGENLYITNALTNSSLSWGPKVDNFYNPYYPYGYETSFEMAKGKLILHKSLDNLGNTVKEINNLFEFHDDYNITRATFSSVGNNPLGTVILRYLSADYNLVEQNKTLDGLIINTKYKFDNQHQMYQECFINSNKKTIETSYKYPYNSEVSSQPFINGLIVQNRISTPIKQEIHKDNQLISTSLTNYDFYGHGVGGQILPKSISVSKNGQLLEEGLIITQRDNKGNILEYITKDGVYHCYLWGYRQSKPIAKITNATYSQIENHVSINNIQMLSDNDDDNCKDSNCNEQKLRVALNSLRSNLSHAMIYTYTYDPLIGITSITDVKGYTIYYEYDDSNRLKYIKDSSSNPLEEYNYNYKNEYQSNISNPFNLTSKITACVPNSYSAPIPPATGLSSICNYGNIFTQQVGIPSDNPYPGIQLYINDEPASQIRWIRFYDDEFNTIWNVDPLTGIITGVSSYSSNCN